MRGDPALEMTPRRAEQDRQRVPRRQRVGPCLDRRARPHVPRDLLGVGDAKHVDRFEEALVLLRTRRGGGGGRQLAARPGLARLSKRTATLAEGWLSRECKVVEVLAVERERGPHLLGPVARLPGNGLHLGAVLALRAPARVSTPARRVPHAGEQPLLRTQRRRSRREPAFPPPPS